MNFEFSDDQKLIQDQARTFLADKASSAHVRRILDSVEPFDQALWQGVVDLGWAGVIIPEEYGGVGLGYLELCVIAEEMGRSLAPVPLSSTVYLVVGALLEAGSEQQKQQWLPKIAAGECIAVLAVNEQVGERRVTAIETTCDNGKISGHKVPVIDGDVAHLALVLAREVAGVSLFLVDLTQSSVVRQPLTAIDPTRSVAALTFAEAGAQRIGAAGQGEKLLTRIYDRAAVLFAFEQVGGSQAALDMAKAYALQRFAFGRAIGSFQAIKHKLADMYTAVELARANAYYGAWALSTDAPELPLAAATARVAGIQAYYLCSKENIQTHGGMGFTWEFDCHMHYRRAQHLALVIGGEMVWKERLVNQLKQMAVA